MEMPVWALLEDGPLAGKVFEVRVNDEHLQVTPLDSPVLRGTFVYKRAGWFDGKGHYIARFRYSKTLVI